MQDPIIFAPELQDEQPRDFHVIIMSQPTPPTLSQSGPHSSVYIKHTRHFKQIQIKRGNLLLDPVFYI